MVDLNDPMYEFLRDDPVFLMDLFNEYDIGPEPTPGRSAVRVAASDSPDRSHPEPSPRSRRQTMTRARLETDDLESMVLTGAAQKELGIVSETIRCNGDCLSFRMDPGNLFERRGYLYDKQDGTWDLRIVQRYLPHELIATAARADARLVAALPAALQDAVSLARGSNAYCPHWLERSRPQTPPWRFARLLPDPAAATAVTEGVARRARETQTVHFVYAGSGLLTAVNSAPGSGRFYSVTPDGKWSLHHGARTRPLAASPELGTEPGTARRRSVVARQAAGVRR